MGRFARSGGGGQASHQRIHPLVPPGAIATRKPPPRAIARRPPPLFDAEKTKPAERREAGAKSRSERPTTRKRRATTRTKAAAKRNPPHETAGPFVDKQLDKALEIIRAKLAETPSAKARLSPSLATHD